MDRWAVACPQSNPLNPAQQNLMSLIYRACIFLSSGSRRVILLIPRDCGSYRKHPINSIPRSAASSTKRTRRFRRLLKTPRRRRSPNLYSDTSCPAFVTLRASFLLPCVGILGAHRLGQPGCVHQGVFFALEAIWQAGGADMGRHCQDWRVQGARAL